MAALRAEWAALMDAPAGRSEGDLMNPGEITFEADLAAERAAGRAGLGRRCRGLRRPARSPARACPPAEGRPRQDLDPGARGPVPRLHRGGAQAQARAGGRLSRDGGLARLFEIAAVAARCASAGRPERRGYGDRARLAARSASKPFATLPSACSAARSSIATYSSAASPSRSPISSIRNGPRRSTTCYRPTRNSGKRRRSPMCASPSAPSGRWPRRAKRSSG